MAELGFIGLGIMGRPMAGHLIDAGHRVHLHSRSGVPAELKEKGGLGCASSKDVAAKADIIFICVPDTADVEAVLFSPSGVAAGLAPGKTVVDCSSIAPIATRAFAARIADKKCGYLDAPVSGGEGGAKSATLVFMVGGSEADFARGQPYFSLMGKTVVHIGDVGAGQTAKIANQIVVALTIEAVAEGLVFAAKAGADVRKVREALMAGLASSRILDVHGERMIERTFQPGFRIALHAKDLNLALEGARKLALALPNTATCQELFNASAAQGDAGLDHAGIVRVLERLADYEVGTPP